MQNEDSSRIGISTIGMLQRNYVAFGRVKCQRDKSNRKENRRQEERKYLATFCAIEIIRKNMRNFGKELVIKV